MKKLLFFDTPDKINGKVEYILDGRRSEECAWERKDAPDILITLPRSLAVTEINASIHSDKTGFVKGFVPLWCDLDGSCDVFKGKIDLSDLEVGLYFIKIKILTPSGEFFCKKENVQISLIKNAEEASLQFSVSDFGHDKSNNYGVIYHIFVDRFARGENIIEKKGRVIVNDWSVIPEYPEYPGAPLKNTTFYGGSLYGIIDRLDYIRSLGVSLIYLSPIFESPSNHKYDTADYNKVDTGFGGDKALKLLISEAKKRNIGIILDGVFNHTGADSVYFNRYGNYGRGGAYNDASSEYYSWYTFQSYPEKYTSWWGIEILPRINTENPSCREFFTGTNGIIRKYAKSGIAGFRLDVADELSDDLIKEIRKILKEENANALLFGEVWEDGSNKIAYGKRKSYYSGDELDGVMNYPLRKGLISYVRSNTDSELRFALTDIINNAPKNVRNRQMNILGSHDTERILTAIAGESAEGKTNSELSVTKMSECELTFGYKALKGLYTVLTALPGIPVIFYGDEVGMEGYSDPFNRLPYPYGKENKDLLQHYQALGKFRLSSRILAEGEFQLNMLNNDCLIFSRIHGDTRVVTVFNNAYRDLNVTFEKPCMGVVCGEKKLTFTLKSKCAEIFKTTHQSINISI